MEDEGWINYNFTHDACKKGLSANDEELKGNQLLAGLSGFNKEKGLEMVHKWCFFVHLNIVFLVNIGYRNLCQSLVTVNGIFYMDIDTINLSCQYYV